MEAHRFVRRRHTDSGEIVSLKSLSRVTPKMVPTTEAEFTPGHTAAGRLDKLKKKKSSSGIKPSTFRLAA
jgi:hypothetical protein